MAVLGWIQSSERMTGQGGAYPDSLNRALRQLLTDSGYNPDAVSVGQVASIPGNGRTVTTLSQYLDNNKSFNVKDYGAKGDSATDDTVAIQAAINAASAADVTRVVVPATTGYYRITTSLVMPSNVWLVGESGGRWNLAKGWARIRLDNTVDAPVIRNADWVAGNMNIRVLDLYITGGNTGTANCLDFRAAGAAYCKGITVRGCTVRQAAGATLYCDHIGESTFADNTFFDALGNGMFFRSLSDSYVENNEVMAAGEGIYLTDSSGNNIITRNFVFLCLHGIVLIQARNNVISLNRFNTHTREGIQLLGAVAGAVSYNSIIGNICYDNGQGAVGTRAGILVQGASDRNVLSGNVCTNSVGVLQQQGIRIADTATQNLVTGNDCLGNSLGASVAVQDTSTGVNTLVGNLVDTTGFFDIDKLRVGVSTATPQLTIAGGATLLRHLKVDVAWDPPSFLDGAVVSTTVTVTGAQIGDVCAASFNQIGTNVVLVTAHVSAVDTVRVILTNRSGITLDFASGNLRVIVSGYL